MRILILILVLTPHLGRSQCASHFKVATAYYKPNGGGLEVGFWPVESRIGGFLGLAFAANHAQKTKTVESNVEMSTYLKGQFRFNRYFYAVAIAGAHQLDQGYLAAGLRACYPFNERQRFALVGEATYGTDGPNYLFGLSVSLE